MKTSLSSTLLRQLAANSPFMGYAGLTSYEDLEGWYQGLNIFDKINTMIVAVNSLEKLDAIIDPITKEGVDATSTEVYTRSRFKRSTWDTESSKTKVELSDITVQFADYGDGFEISKKMLMKGQMNIVDLLLNSIVPAYQRLHRKLALRALMVMPTAGTDTLQTPGYWRASLGALGKVPYPNEFLTFAATETHYNFQALNENTVNFACKKIRDKGYGEGGQLVVASESTWSAYKALFDWSELERIDLVEYFAGTEFTINPNRKTMIQMADSDFPTGYFLALDPTVQGLYRKVAENPALRGLVKMFSNENEIFIKEQAEFKILELGYGVVERGFGNVVYVGAYDAATNSFPVAPTAYVNPTIAL